MTHHLQRQGSRDQDSPPCFRPSTSSLTLSVTSSSGCDVVKRGSLYVKRLPTKRAVRISIKTWQKKYLVLRDDWKDSGKTTLDIYDRESDSVTPEDHNKPPSLFFLFPSRPFTVDLCSVVSVDLYLESRTFVHALVVDRSDGFPVILGAQSDLEMKCWLAAIKLLADKANQLVPRIHRPPSCPSHLAYDVKRPLKGSMSLISKLNHSTPQLCKVARGPTARHLSIEPELSSSNLSKRLNDSYIDVVRGDSTPTSTPRTPILSDYHSSSRKNSKSLIMNYPNHKEAGSKWMSFPKTIRKDSGFSESFDESFDQFQSSFSPPQDTVEEEDDYVNHASSSPPPLPPRHLSCPFTPSPRTPAVFHDPWLVSTGPPKPKPPPRPIHTLTIDSW